MTMRISERGYITLFGTTGRINDHKLLLCSSLFHVTGQIAINSHGGCSNSARVPAYMRACVSHGFSVEKKVVNEI